MPLLPSKSLGPLILLVTIWCIFASFVVSDDETRQQKRDRELFPGLEEPLSAAARFKTTSDVFLYDVVREDSLGTDFNTSENDKYQGEWTVQAPSEVDAHHLMLSAPSKARHYGLIRKFPKPLKVQHLDFVLQYEVKYASPLSCAGSYVKLIHQDALENMPRESFNFDDSTPYVIMFGPDYCGSNNKVHFILRHENPVTHQWSEHHLKNPPPIENNQLTHVYTLIIRQDNSFEILIDGDSKKKGSLLEDMDPPINPEKMIDDPEDVKPADWVDEEYIDDPDAVKPEDWDETEPEEIPDPNDAMPQGWLVDEPTQIADPEASQPVDWDEEEDGIWQAPLVANPKCEAVGCGEWTPRFIKNPKFKGKWHAPKIRNPAYKGVWKPRLIDNPHYFEDAHPHNLPPMGALFIDIWTMDDNISFGSFLISSKEDDARNYIAEVWGPRNEAEKALLPPTEDGSSKPITETIINFIWSKLQEVPMPILLSSGLFAVMIPLVVCFGMYRSLNSAFSAPKDDSSKFGGKGKKDSDKEQQEALLQDEDEEVVSKSVTDSGSDSAKSLSSVNKTRKRRKAKKVL